MRHDINLTVRRKNRISESVMRCRKVGIREKLMRFVFGKTQAMTIIIPGETVDAIQIKEIGEEAACETV